MRFFRILASASTFFLFASAAMAQKMVPRLEIFAEGGGSFLTGGTGQGLVPVPVPSCPPEGPCPAAETTEVVAVASSFSKTGRLVAGARLRFTRHDALEASYSLSPNHLTLQAQYLPTYSSFNRVNLVSFNYVRYLSVKARVQPFATGGVGLNRFSGPLNAPAVVDGLTSASNGFQFAWNFGCGTDIVLQRHLAIRVELRDYLTGQPSPITGTNQNIVPSAGLVYRFM